MASLFEVAPVETASMTTRDGVRLDADIWRPVAQDSGQTFPVLLMRQPYGRRIALSQALQNRRRSSDFYLNN